MKYHQSDNAWIAFRKVCDACGLSFLDQYFAWEKVYRPLIDWDFVINERLPVPKIIPAESEVHREVMMSTDPELCSEGPARTAKTMRNLQKDLALHCKYYGFRSAVIRVNAVDLDDTIRTELVNLILRHQLDDPRSQIKQQGGLSKFYRLYLNGGVMRLGGMSRPGAILGGKYDLAICSELSQFSEEMYQLIKTRVTGDSGKWVLKDGRICFQMLSDTNPDIPSHWMYQRETEGLLRFLKFDFTDNPYYFRKGRWTRVGKTSVDELDRGNTGIWHDRYFKGLRKAPEGAVFDLEDCHIIDKMPKIDDSVKIYRMADFGMSPSPNVCVWLVECQVTGDVTAVREWRALNADTIEMAESIKAFDLGKVARTITDNDKNAISILRRNGIPAIPAVKGPDSVKLRIALMNAALNRTRNGEDGAFRIYRGLRCNKDSQLALKKRRMSLIEEMEGLVYGEDREQLVGEHHAVDACGYFFLWKNTAAARPQLDARIA